VCCQHGGAEIAPRQSEGQIETPPCEVSHRRPTTGKIGLYRATKRVEDTSHVCASCWTCGTMFKSTNNTKEEDHMKVRPVVYGTIAFGGLLLGVGGSGWEGKALKKLAEPKEPRKRQSAPLVYEVIDPTGFGFMASDARRRSMESPADTEEAEEEAQDEDAAPLNEGAIVACYQSIVNNLTRQDIAVLIEKLRRYIRQGVKAWSTAAWYFCLGGLS
jgi:hypothetical protein